ncbi:hypothetical protein [Mycobacteroides abscessus]|nr:hypothetical protein [Mycobacteroides abscessus]
MQCGFQYDEALGWPEDGSSSRLYGLRCC